VISSRFSLPVVLLLSLALIPTVIHNYMGLVIDDGLRVTKVNSRLGVFTSESTNRKAPWVKKIFDSDDWFERVYHDSIGSTVRLFVARSYDHKRLYHHPELALSYGQDIKSGGIVFLQLDQHKIPVHTLRSVAGEIVAAYVLHYDGAFIENPIAHQMFDSLNLLVSGRKSLTLFYLSDHDGEGVGGVIERPVVMVLLDAISDFIDQ